MVTTERMVLYPISKEELQVKIGEERDEEMKKAYTEMLAGCIKKPEQHIWYTVWMMQLNTGNKQIIGDLSFKGLNKDGSVEIGYGIGTHVFDFGVFASFANWKYQEIGCKFTFELFNR